jgi:hypothetical protein
MPWAAGRYVSGPPAGSLFSHVFAVVFSQPLCVVFLIVNLISRDFISPRFSVLSLRFIQTLVTDFPAGRSRVSAFANVHVKTNLSRAFFRQKSRFDLNSAQLSSS